MRQVTPTEAGRLTAHTLFDGWGTDLWIEYREKIAQAIAKARRDAWEQAARECDDESKIAAQRAPGHKPPDVQQRSATANHCARRIRKLGG